MLTSSDREEAQLRELEKIVASDDLVRTLDILLPAAKKIAKQPSSVSFIILFGSLFAVIAVVMGFAAHSVYLFPWGLVAFCTALLTGAGMCLGNIVAVGKKGLAAERHGRAVAAFLTPVIPILNRSKQTKALQGVTKQLGESVQGYLASELSADKNETAE